MATSGVLVVVCILHLLRSVLFRQMVVPFSARFRLIGVLSLLGRANLARRDVLSFPLISIALGRVEQLSGMSFVVSFPIATRSGRVLSPGSGVVLQVLKLQLSRAAVVPKWLVSDGVFKTIVTRERLPWAVSVET